MPSTSLSHIKIRAVRTATSDSTDSVAPIETESSPSGGVLDLSDGVWQLQASASRYWSQETEVAVSRRPADGVQLTLWPAASLHGEIRIPEGETPPVTLEVSLKATPSSNETISQTPGLTPPHAELHCRIANAAWNCLAPAGVYDVQMLASGYTPRYEWGLNFKADDNVDLGTTALRRTASVFGRAVRKDGSEPPGPCRAILKPEIERHGPGDPEAESTTAEERGFSVPLNRRGYFQIVGVLPGPHVLTVVCPAASGFRELRVQAEGETRIDPPLSLEELTLDVAITPKVDPQGQPWQLTVDETAPRYQRIANKVTTSTDGHWLGRGLMTGNYRVTVHSADGTSWLQRYFDLKSGSGPVSLYLSSVNVAGRVMLSSQPVQARLVFSNNTNGASVTLTSDNNGRFQGILPVTPNVREISTWTVEAHVSHPSVNQQLLNISVPVGNKATAWLDLTLPTIAVRGSVVSQDGQPQRGIEVTFEDSNRIRTSTSTDEAGNFEMPELQPGKYTAIADSQDGTSDREEFEVTQGSESELKLVLNPYRRVPFYVVSSQGPVPNAAVQVWIKPGVPRAFAHTDENGRFEITVPPGNTEVALTVGARGYALKLTRLQIPSGSDDSPNNTNTINLDDSGGKLTLNFQKSGNAPNDSTMFYLVHNGAIQDARSIVGWGTNQAGASADGPAIVEAIEPGKYALCSLSDSSQLTSLWSGALPSNQCHTGSLDQGETLNLSSQ